MQERPIPGLTLKLERVAARVRAKDVGEAMGISRSRVSIIEGQARVLPATARRYREALETCRTYGGEVA